ncbi:hypothetical protein ANO11243_066160 [Dothideomycetidae sp. 11243]|nr:hypothetical protein ANO11243_066160 [fungal sp. No.11243]
MPAAIEQALITLVPFINSLPAELVNLAEALLSQSKAKAPNLKAEEEIGRIYACAHLACERSKARLGLDKLVPRPPCPPRIYKKLYAFLDAQLTSPSTPRTQRHIDALSTPKSRNAPTTPASRKRTAEPDGGEDVTPSRRAEKRARAPSSKALSNEAATLGAQRASGTASAAVGGEKYVSGVVPAFVDLMIQRLLRAFSAAEVAANVRSGFEYVLSLRGWVVDEPRSRPGAGKGVITPARMPGLLVALVLLVLTRREGRNVDTEEFVARRARAVNAVREMQEGWRLADEELVGDIKGFLMFASKEGWLEMPWFTTVEENSGVDLVMVDDGEEDELALAPVSRMKPYQTPLRRSEKHAPRPAADVLDPSNTAAGLVVGLGTMFQDAVDWLRHERRAEYREWKEDIMNRIKQIEASPKTAKTTPAGRRVSKEAARVPGL